MLLYFMSLLTIRNGKTRPIMANINQRWMPMMTNDASRLDWMKSSLLRVAVAPPDDTGHVIQLIIIACKHLFYVQQNAVCNVLNFLFVSPTLS